MPRRRLAPLLAFVAVLLSFVVPGCEGSRPGGRRTLTSRSCADCHQPFVQSLAGRTPHFTDLESRCEDCHDRHGLVGVLKLKQPEPELCLQCHQDVGVPGEGQFAHTPVADGQCSACHDPHASVGEGHALLRAEGPALCTSCHEADSFTGPQVHEPVADDCLACHDPHVNATQGGLVQPVPQLCATCHDAGAPEFTAAHQGYDVSTSDCRSCHAPHEAPTAALLQPSVHAPLDMGDCSSCHVDPDEATAGATPETLLPADELCTFCHDAEAEEYASRPSPHAPVIMGACTDCHQPHASAHPTLLRAEPDQRLCASCHDTAEQIAEFSDEHASPHVPAAEGRCLDCHDAHGGQEEPLLAKPLTELCTSCHEDVGQEFDKQDVHFPLDTCTACHAPHGSKQRPILAERQSDLCLSCHEDQKQRMLNEKVHRPVAQGQCMTCHEPHGADHAGLLRAEPEALCQECHADVVRAGPGDSIHAPAALGQCLSCHEPHSSKQSGLLLQAPTTLCTSCHGLTKQAANEVAFPHPPAQAGACLACHAPHVAPRKALLSLDTQDLCASCHGDVLAEMAEPGATSHPPAADGQCLDCHEPHGSDHPGMASAAVPELCWNCHDQKDPDLQSVHLGLLEPGTDCMSCHAPHASSSPGLFWPDLHPPFAMQSCDDCHDNAQR